MRASQKLTLLWQKLGIKNESCHPNNRIRVNKCSKTFSSSPKSKNSWFHIMCHCQREELSVRRRKVSSMTNPFLECCPLHTLRDIWMEEISSGGNSQSPRGRVWLDQLEFRKVSVREVPTKKCRYGIQNNGMLDIKKVVWMTCTSGQISFFRSKDVMKISIAWESEGYAMSMINIHVHSLSVHPPLRYEDELHGDKRIKRKSSEVSK